MWEQRVCSCVAASTIAKSFKSIFRVNQLRKKKNTHIEEYKNKPKKVIVKYSQVTDKTWRK